MKKNQHGFGTIEVFVIVIVAVLLGGVGYYVYKNQNKTNPTGGANKSQSEQQPSNEVPDQQAQDEPKGLKEYKNTELGFTFSYPAAWKSFGVGTDDTLIDPDVVGFRSAASETAFKNGSNSAEVNDLTVTVRNDDISLYADTILSDTKSGQIRRVEYIDRGLQQPDYSAYVVAYQKNSKWIYFSFDNAKAKDKLSEDQRKLLESIKL